MVCPVGIVTVAIHLELFTLIRTVQIHVFLFFIIEAFKRSVEICDTMVKSGLE